MQNLQDHVSPEDLARDHNYYQAWRGVAPLPPDEAEQVAKKIEDASARIHLAESRLWSDAGFFRDHQQGGQLECSNVRTGS